jgi:hypothetical protein
MTNYHPLHTKHEDMPATTTDEDEIRALVALFREMVRPAVLRGTLPRPEDRGCTACYVAQCPFCYRTRVACDESPDGVPCVGRCHCPVCRQSIIVTTECDGNRPGLILPLRLLQYFLTRWRRAPAPCCPPPLAAGKTRPSPFRPNHGEAA